MKLYLLSASMILLSGFVQASANPKLSFCFEEWMPYAYLSEEKQFLGHSIETIKSALDKQGIDYEFTQLPHLQCVERVAHSSIDFGLHVDESDELTLIDYQVAEWTLTFATLNSSQLTVNDILNDPTKKMALSRNYSYPEQVLQLLSGAKVKQLKTSFLSETPEQIQRIFSLLTNNRIDALLIDKRWADLMISRYNLPVKTMTEVIHIEPQYIGFNKRNKFKAKLLSHALNNADL